MVGIEAVDGEADIDVLELLCLGLPILVARLPIDIIKVVHKICWSYKISAFDGEKSQAEQHIYNLVNLGKIGAVIVVIRHLYNCVSSIGIVVEISLNLKVAINEKSLTHPHLQSPRARASGA